MSQDSATVAIVTASYKGDFERCRLLCESIDRHVTGFTCHYLLVEEADRALFKALEGERRKVLGERDLLPPWLRAVPDPTNLKRRLWIHPFGLPLRGWHAQQLRRIAFGLQMAEDAMLSSDSDVVFLRPFDARSLIEDGRTRFQRVENGLDDILPDLLDDHLSWSRAAGRLLGIASPAETRTAYISPLVPWRGASVKAMGQRIEEATGRSAFRALVGTRALSECTIYGRFVDEVERRLDVHAVTPEPLIDVYWAGEAMGRAEVEAFIERLAPGRVGIGVQSFTATDPNLIRAAAGFA
jgi:hypothetical protein